MKTKDLVRFLLIITVTNDVEGSVALVQIFSGCLTKEEQQQVVSQHHKDFSKPQRAYYSNWAWAVNVTVASNHKIIDLNR